MVEKENDLKEDDTLDKTNFIRKEKVYEIMKVSCFFVSEMKKQKIFIILVIDNVVLMDFIFFVEAI